MVYSDTSNADDDIQEKRYTHLKEQLETSHKGRYRIHRGYSLNVSKSFDDSSLDFVYVDARHDFMGVLEDCEA